MHSMSKFASIEPDQSDAMPMTYGCRPNWLESCH